ncbi:hypothetical protein THAOC_25436 [Thalassiosira oceanica]|uniref:Fibronectin type-III domain-containing protein n=1 Tax=Thalassiosira oceanica TaxID=159749 RepID=K0S7U4_THAOC|nr:hypothetical protein THAOC_25436 [Thalassiosira oceanica]|eukprot:EJK54897.1 hypothetical protein THAOC_25436 [Thalassiosira oceanica]
MDEFDTKASVAVPGELPAHYGSAVVGSTTNEFEIEGLVTGKEYFVSVSARNSQYGLSKCAQPSPFSVVPPLQVPDSPQAVSLDVNEGYSDSVLVDFDAPASDGGSPILFYRVELDPTPSFDYPIVQDFFCPESNKRTEWQVETSTSGDGIIVGGSFSLEVEVNGFSSTTAEIPYNAVSLSSDEVGISDELGPNFSTTSGSNAITTTPSVNIEEVLFPGERLRFSGQGHPFKYYEVQSVSATTATLTEAYEGVDGIQVSTTRHYGGRGTPLSSRVHCQYSEDLCSHEVEAQSGSIQSKIEDLSLPLQEGVSADRDGPGAGNSFIWRITFLDDHSPSSSVSIATRPMVVPSAPTSVTLDVVSATELKVLFGSPSDNGGDAISHYLIEWSLSSDFSSSEFSILDYLAGGSPFFKVIQGLDMGESYFVRVSAYNSQGYGISQMSTPPSLNPHQRSSPPTNVRLGVTTLSMLTIGWEAPLSDGGDSITNYRVEWDTKNSYASSSLAPNKGFVDVDSATTSHTLELLSPAKSYHVRVFAKNRSGLSAAQLATPSSATPSLQVPGIPFALMGVPGTDLGSIEVSWQRPRVPHHGIPCSNNGDMIIDCPAPFGGSVPASDGGDDIFEYELEWRESSSDASHAKRAVYSGFHAVLTNLVVGKSYSVRVLARNSQGSGSFSEPVLVEARGD